IGERLAEAGARLAQLGVDGVEEVARHGGRRRGLVCDELLDPTLQEEGSLRARGAAALALHELDLERRLRLVDAEQPRPFALEEAPRLRLRRFHLGEGLLARGGGALRARSGLALRDRLG